jgi:hypothetical protein
MNWLNWHFLLPFFQWCDSTALGDAMRRIPWAFPTVETIHIMALTVLFGTLFAIDLRLVGLGLKEQTVADLACALLPYLNASLAVMLTTGPVMFLSEANKDYDNDAFKFKMLFLFFALLFHFLVFRRFVRRSEPELASAAAKLVGVFSFGLWLMVGVGGRAIGFV